ncbi:MAG TPA: hypothetical protein VG010_05795 [Solirubrobacteraceae bacterium]|nr:hypothetical protein [Solirubrobacteraceae bacterium]
MTDLAASLPPSSMHSSGSPGVGAPQPVGAELSEACPLCGTPLHREQEWCLHCGAAARTRLAATPNWRVPVGAILAVMAISLAVLAAALVDLAGSSTPTRTQVTRTVTAPAAASAPAATAPATPAPATATPGATATTRTAPTQGAIAPGATSGARGSAPASGAGGLVAPAGARSGATPTLSHK